MRVALFTSVSQNIADMATVTLANKVEYCLRHGYSLIADNRPYADAVAGVSDLVPLLDVYDVLWTLDSDAVITDMEQRIESLDCLGPHVTVCEEGIVDWNLLNCGSVVWRNTPGSRWLMQSISEQRPTWASLPCGWQTWLANISAGIGDILTVAPLRAFNSCVWNRPGNGEGAPGSLWRPGDFVFHPCGVFPHEVRLEYIAAALSQVKR